MFKDGIYDNIGIHEYHTDKEYISSSALKEAVKSLAHFDFYYKKPNERKSHFDFGNCFELALMDVINCTNEFDKFVTIFDTDQRPETDKTMASNANKTWKESVLNTDKYIINKYGDESLETMKLMLESCIKDSVINALIKNTDYQKSLFWTDKTTGLKIKTRPDVCKITKSVIVDIKTTKDASPEKFAKDAANYQYPMQAITQINGCISTGLMKPDKYFWLAVEKTAPFNAQLYEFKKEDWQFMDDRYNYQLGLIKMAKDENKFPGYTQRADNQHGILELELPMWFK